jgi:mycothiol synthase
VTITANTTDLIKLKNAPRLPGIAFRRFRGEADYEAMAWIINEANKADGDDALANVEDIANTYAHLSRSDADTDMIFVEDHGRAVGYGRCWWGQEVNGDYLYTFFINLHPGYRRDGIPLPMGQFLIDRSTAIAAQHPAEAPKYFQTWGIKGSRWHEDLMETLRLSAVRYEYFMNRPCSLPVEVTPLPDGIEVRPVGPEDYRAVYDASHEAFRDHWGYTPPSEQNYQRWLNESTFDPSLWRVAWEGDQVVGMVRSFHDLEENAVYNRRRGYTENISVRRPWRRRGIARSLLTQSIKMFQEMGYDETCLGVDTENPNGALKLYQSVGYTDYLCIVTYRAPIV